MKEMSKVPARWDHVKEVVDLRNKIQQEKEKKTLIIGNGDVLNISDAKNKIEITGADGAMLGRAIFGNPWLFTMSGLVMVTPQEKLRVMIEHTKLFEELLGDIKNFAIMKKHYKAYVNGWDGAKELRQKLMEANNVQEVENIIKDDPIWTT